VLAEGQPGSALPRRESLRKLPRARRHRSRALRTDTRCPSRMEVLQSWANMRADPPLQADEKLLLLGPPLLFWLCVWCALAPPRLHMADCGLEEPLRRDKRGPDPLYPPHAGRVDPATCLGRHAQVLASRHRALPLTRSCKHSEGAKHQESVSHARGALHGRISTCAWGCATRPLVCWPRAGTACRGRLLQHSRVASLRAASAFMESIVCKSTSATVSDLRPAHSRRSFQRSS